MLQWQAKTIQHKQQTTENLHMKAGSMLISAIS